MRINTTTPYQRRAFFYDSQIDFVPKTCSRRAKSLKRKMKLHILTCLGLLVISFGSIESVLPKSEQAKDAARDYENDEVFEDAIDHWSEWPENDNIEDAEDIFYDAREVFEEEDGNKVCPTANRHDCDTCCRAEGFTKPFWDKSVGECKCYQEKADSSVCSLAKEADTCNTCCKAATFDRSDYFRSACYCSVLP